MQAWSADPSSLSQIPQLHRTLHTMKGGARMAGVMALGDLSHAMESLLSAIDNGLIKASSDIFALAQRTADHIGSQIDELQSGNGVHVDRNLVEELQHTAKTGQVRAVPRSGSSPQTPPAPVPADDGFGVAPEVQVIRSREEYDQLPSGSVFRAPDGSIRVKP
jgi:chemosensory pili system protein ChpA (sensor histidine kinase/response regulator)